jgi:uncharacterized protein YndB with AHSA1/START domain
MDMALDCSNNSKIFFMNITSDLTARASATIQVPVDRVWEALVTPALIQQYLHGTHVETDWKEGSPINFHGEWKGKTYHDKGVIKRIVKNKLLVYSFWSSLSGKADDASKYIIVSYQLEDQHDKTVLTITADDPEADEKVRDHMAQNWQMVLDSLKKILEAK